MRHVGALECKTWHVHVKLLELQDVARAWRPSGYAARARRCLEYVECGTRTKAFWDS
jgi:hypothetical protein